MPATMTWCGGWRPRRPPSIPDQFTALAAALGLEAAADPDALRAQVHDALRDGRAGCWSSTTPTTSRIYRPWLPGGAAAGRDARARHRHHPPGRLQLAGSGDGPGRDRPGRCRGAIADPGAGPGQATGEAIADELGRLPLALEQAAAYLDRAAGAGRGVPGAAPHPSGRAVRAAARSAAPDRYRGHPVGRQPGPRLRRRTRRRYSSWSVCAYLAPEPIPLDLFTAHADLLPEPLSAAAADPLTFTEAIAGAGRTTRWPSALSRRAPSAPARAGRHPGPPSAPGCPLQLATPGQP